jgi:hypothetical protein
MSMGDACSALACLEEKMRLAMLVFVVLAAFPAAAQNARPVGTWKLVSFIIQYEGEAPQDRYGPNPRGYLIITPQNRLMTVNSSSNRKQGTSEEDKAAQLDSASAYTGHFTVNGDGNTLTTTVEVAAQEGLVGTQQVRHFKVDGNRPLISAPPQPSVLRSDHKMFTQQLVWERAQ